MFGVTPLRVVIVLGLIVIGAIVVVGFGPEVGVQLKGQVVASATTSCAYYPPCLLAQTCREPVAAVACSSPSCNWGPCTSGATLTQCTAVFDPCKGVAGCLAPVSARPVACSDPTCNQGPCQVATTGTGPTSCPAGSEYVCPSCVFGTPPEKCQCACSPSTNCPAWPLCLRALVPAGCTCTAPKGCSNLPPTCPAGQVAEVVSQTASIPPSCQYECRGTVVNPKATLPPGDTPIPLTIPVPQPTPAPSGFSWLNPINWFTSQPEVTPLPYTSTFPAAQPTVYPVGNTLPTYTYATPAPNTLPTDIYVGNVTPTPAFDADGVPIYTNPLLTVSPVPAADQVDAPSVLGRFWQRITQGIGNGWEAVRNWRGLRNQAN